MKNCYLIIFFHLIIATPQINLYFTDMISDNKIHHDCLRVSAFLEEANLNRQIISYCMTESLSKYNIQKNHQFPKFTFEQLAKQNITSQQLYHWSVPIDIIEDYQFYLNQLANANTSSLANKIFHNCTLPRFGSICQYEFDYYHSNYATLYEFIHDYYHSYTYLPNNFTCYTHLECNRGPLPSCLDWSEICDGKIDCSDNEIDEKYCWELEINECNDDEYRCMNGQCIPKVFYRDDYNTPDCLDQSDEHRSIAESRAICNLAVPSVGCEDIRCLDAILTSSCLEQRTQLLIDALFSVQDAGIKANCWSAFRCLTLIPEAIDPMCDDFCENEICLDIIEQHCPEMLLIPSVPVLFNNIYFAYRKEDAWYLYQQIQRPPYKCYNNSLYDDFYRNSSRILFKNLTCYRPEDLPEYSMLPVSWKYFYFQPVYDGLSKYDMIMNYTSERCNRSNVYQCINSSKCISMYRFLDGKNDCPHNDDEDITKINNTHHIERTRQTYFKCHISNKYIPQSSIRDGKCDCGYIEIDWCEDENVDKTCVRRSISFQTICDGYTELSPIIIDGENHTDETECQQWPCNHIYTHCDGFWRCSKGEDEIDCYSTSAFNCSIDQHICVSFDTNQLTCLPMEKANDGNIDCLGATDEPNFCYSISEIHRHYNFKCINDNSTLCVADYDLCNNIPFCGNNADEEFCEKNRTLGPYESVCDLKYSSIRSNVEHFLCNIVQDRAKQQIKYFLLDTEQDLAEDSIENIGDSKPSIVSLIDKTQQQQQLLLAYCHRGLALKLWLENEINTTRVCLCPPSYYGDQCQYQNQRVTLSLQFRTPSNSWQIPFTIFVSLIDDSYQRIIHSYEHFTYLSARDCQIKFNVYLLYSARPKNSSKEYSIHIDIYEKVSLYYRGSLLYPIRFSFLPVHRLAFIINIPRDNNTVDSCLNNECIHGKCSKYSNEVKNQTFCQCDRGWSGKYCDISHNCQCSLDSKCIGVINDNRSICVCPLHRFGPRCLLIKTVCSINNRSLCENGAECIPNDEYIQSNQKYTCICRKGFIGKRCEIVENQIMLTFNKDFFLSESIFIHFIQVMKNDQPRRTTTVRTIPFKRDAIIIHWSQPFHIVFIELNKQNYYLIHVQSTYNHSIPINTTINSLNRCRNISELFNNTILRLHLLRRIKYYHIPCQRQDLNLSCFYDDIHFCICQQHGQQRVANCFEYNHNMTFNCFGQSVCENSGQCFQDTPNCPQRSVCICPSCYYGTRCQFSTSGFRISLDAILGYHIQPNITMTKQPSIVQISAALSCIFISVGLINSILALITFQNKSIRNVGCGIYLLCGSITTLLTTIMFGLKFWILILAQINIITNRTFLSFQCHSIDFLLRIGLNIDQWLNACVAMERAITVIKGPQFNKRTSKRIAKLVIIILLIVIIGTNSQDPIYRHLIDEENEDEKRTWCIVSYTSSLRTFTYVMTIFHFLFPFILNLISAILLIITKSRQKSHIQIHQNYNQHLRKQIQEHKYLLIAPIVLIILALPHLIISFASKCMKSSNDSWLYVVGYFISFIPPMLTFVVFILPSKFYKKEFRKTVVRYRMNIQRRLHVTL